MSVFTVRFLICNLLIAGILFPFLLIKRLLTGHVSARVQYNLWFLFLGLLFVPFLPFRFSGMHGISHFLDGLSKKTETSAQISQTAETALTQSTAANWANDFTVSVCRKTPSRISLIFLCFWTAGILIMLFLISCSLLRFYSLKRLALPLDNPDILVVFEECKTSLHIRQTISVYSTAAVTSPVTTGLLHPRIYLPLSLLFDYKKQDLRYIFLHELQHSVHKDALPNFFATAARILYWFNPAVWFALREMHTDREVACDASVLQALSSEDYLSYGASLIDFAEKLSFPCPPFANGLSGTMVQMRKRIRHIASYKSPTRKQTLHGLCAYTLVLVLLIGLAPLFSTYAAEETYTPTAKSHMKTFDEKSKASIVDYSSYFQNYAGSFVLYDTASDSWSIYNEKLAYTRVSPDSTYKLYEALMCLDYGVISPEESKRKWDGTSQPFAAWNADQDLNSAMKNSVNWYFAALENEINTKQRQSYLDSISYGNCDLSAGTTSWMESSLKISPIEQVELLLAFHENRLSDSIGNTNAVKNSLLSLTDTGQILYGKTGTGRVNGRDINGWFIGYVEMPGRTCYFATNIQGKENATGSKASEITQKILSEIYP